MYGCEVLRVMHNKMKSTGSLRLDFVFDCPLFGGEFGERIKIL